MVLHLLGQCIGFRRCIDNLLPKLRLLRQVRRTAAFQFDRGAQQLQSAVRDLDEPVAQVMLGWIVRGEVLEQLQFLRNFVGRGLILLEECGISCIHIPRARPSCSRSQALHVGQGGLHVARVGNPALRRAQADCSAVSSDCADQKEHHGAAKRKLGSRSL